MRIRLRPKKEPPDGWLTIWDKEQGRRSAQCMKLSFIRTHTPEEMRRIFQHKREELEKYHESKGKFPDDPLKWYGHPHTKRP